MSETKPSPNTGTWHVYILRCSDHSYYVGHAQDVDERVARHNAGRGPTWTAELLPVTLVYQEPFESRSSAMKRENQLKKWSRAKKEALITANAVELSRLSASRSSR